MKQKIGFAIGMLIIAALVFCSPWAEQDNTSNFGSILSYWGESQEQVSDRFTTAAVSGVEGSFVGVHEVNGSNWAIPNIIRHWLGVR